MRDFVKLRWTRATRRVYHRCRADDIGKFRCYQSERVIDARAEGFGSREADYEIESAEVI